MWDKLAECTASTIDQFFTWKQTFFGPNSTFPPLPPCNVVHKERLAKESSNTASGGGGGGKGGASEYCSNSGKRHSVPHILARIVACKCTPIIQSSRDELPYESRPSPSSYDDYWWCSTCAVQYFSCFHYVVFWFYNTIILWCLLTVVQALRSVWFLPINLQPNRYSTDHAGVISLRYWVILHFDNSPIRNNSRDGKVWQVHDGVKYLVWRAATDEALPWWVACHWAAWMCATSTKWTVEESSDNKTDGQVTSQ